MSAKHVRQSAIFVQRKMYKYKTINEAPPSSLDLGLVDLGPGEGHHDGLALGRVSHFLLLHVLKLL